MNMKIMERTSNFDRHTVATQAMSAASKVRQRLDIKQHIPVCIYDVCHQLGVTVRFNDVNMEGMYQKGERPHIHLSAKRPLARRVFTCGHELGHHEFGHGSSIDELREDADNPSWNDPKEFLADTFSAHLLMPAIGLRGAFNTRKISPDTATPEQLYVIACDFGVGYGTLITHLSVGLRMMSSARAATMKRIQPKEIRARLLGEYTSSPLIVAGTNRLNPRIDVEVGTLIFLPKETKVDADRLLPIRVLKNAALYRATKPGIAQIRAPKWAAFVRIARDEYVGLARYRHLEDD